MRTTRAAYLEAATSVVDLLASATVAQAWQRPSALARFSVGGLAGHLASQVFNTELVLTVPVPADAEVTGVLAHYAKAAWIDADLDDPANEAVRAGGDRLAILGAAALADRARQAVEAQHATLAAQPDLRVIFIPWAGWSMLLDDFLTTRTLEMAVHSDDLAVSVGVPTPTLPAEVIDPVIAILSHLSMRRHGQAALLRALSRAERAPATISAI